MSLTLIGDPKQTLYSFRSAMPDLLDQLETIFEKPVTPLELLTNYRSPSQLVALSNFFAESFINIKNVQPSKPHKGALDNVLRVSAHEDAYKEFASIAKQIQQEYEAGTPYEKMTILSRTNRALSDMEAALISSKIPYTIKYDSRQLSKQSGFRFFYCIFTLSLNPKDTAALEEVAQFLGGIGEKTAGSLVSTLKAYFRANPTKNIFSVDHDNFGRAGRGANTLHSFLERVIKPIRHKVNTGGEFLEILQFAYTLIGKECSFTQYKGEAGERGEEDKKVEKKKDLVLSFDEYVLEKAIRTFRSIYLVMCDEPIFRALPNSDQFLEMYTTLQTSQDLTDGEDTVSGKKVKKAVTVSTIHSAKGLQNEIIFFCNAKPSKAYNSQELEDERCAMYVAITRAERRLYISYSALVVQFDGRLKPSVDSPLLNEYMTGAKLFSQGKLK